MSSVDLSDYTLNLSLENEVYLYETMINEIKLAIDHDANPFIYHGCEFVNEIIYRTFYTKISKFYVIPISVFYVFLVYINNNESLDSINFCNFLCADHLDINCALEIYPEELNRMLSGVSVIQYDAAECTQTQMCHEIYKFLYGLSSNARALNDKTHRQLTYYMAKIFKHKASIAFCNNAEKVNAYFALCKNFLMKHKHHFRFHRFINPEPDSD